MLVLELFLLIFFLAFSTWFHLWHCYLSKLLLLLYANHDIVQKKCRNANRKVGKNNRMQTWQKVFPLNKTYTLAQSTSLLYALSETTMYIVRSWVLAQQLNCIKIKTIFRMSIRVQTFWQKFRLTPWALFSFIFINI